MFCEKCGSEIKNGDSFCTNCGNQCLNSEKSSKNSSSKKKANLLLVLVHIILLIVIGGAFYFFCIKDDKNLEKGALKNDLGDKYSKAVFASSSKYLQVDPNDIKYFNDNEKEETQNIEIIETFRGQPSTLMDGITEFIIYGKNNNNYPVTITFNLNLYDNEDYRLEKKTEKVYVAYANSEFAIKVLESFCDRKDMDFQKYNITYSATKPESYYKIMNVSKEDLNINKEEQYGEDVLIASYKNNNEKAISKVSILIRYYDDNGKLTFVDVEDISKILNNVNPGETETTSFKLKNISYSKYDVQVFGSYFYDSTSW